MQTCGSISTALFCSLQSRLVVGVGSWRSCCVELLVAPLSGLAGCVRLLVLWLACPVVSGSVGPVLCSAGRISDRRFAAACWFRRAERRSPGPPRDAGHMRAPSHRGRAIGLGLGLLGGSRDPLGLLGGCGGLAVYWGLGRLRDRFGGGLRPVAWSQEWVATGGLVCLRPVGTGGLLQSGGRGEFGCLR